MSPQLLQVQIVKPTPSAKKKMQHYFKIMMQLPKTKFTTSANDAKKLPFHASASQIE